MDFTEFSGDDVSASFGLVLTAVFGGTMKRLNPCILLSPLMVTLACGDPDQVNTSDSNSGGASASRGTDSMGIDSVSGSGTMGGDATIGDSQGGNSQGGADGTADGTAGGTMGGGDATMGGGADSDDADGTIGGGEGSGGGTTGGDDNDGGMDDGPGTSGGIELPPKPEDPPGQEKGPCIPGELRFCWTGSPANYDIGICEPGLQECVAIDLDIGEWGPCQDETFPVDEVCDGFDNDCDGDIDEDQGTTNCGMGVCNHDEPNCIDGVPNNCDPDVGAMFEVCNKIDDDCDGDIDEGLGEDVVTCGLGACEHTVTDCEGGDLPECDPFEGSSLEVCDGIDNDCDGDVDEGIPDISCGMFDCEVTIPGCIGGMVPMCEPLPGEDEICDGLDNDCDGLTDEDQGTWTCGDFACQVTIPQCDDGVPVPQNSCEPIPGGAEICGNGIDDNCDGEDPPCAENYLVGTDTTARPIDIIWMIDTSGSMAEEIAQVESEINAFATALDAAGGNNQLHLIADRGGDQFEMCVSPPLGGLGCADNPPPAGRFFQYDTNGGGVSMVHSSNALGRAIQQYGSGWGPNLLPNSYLAFIVTTDDDGDDVNWVAPDDLEDQDDCQDGGGNINNGSAGNVCRFNDGMNTYTSLAEDFGALLGFESFIENYFPGYMPGADWAFYSIIGNTGTTVLGAGAPDNFNGCATSVEDGDEYVRLSQTTGTTADMISICDPPPWDLDELATAIASNVPNDTFVLGGNPVGNCLAVNPATISVVVNGVPLAGADWSYDALACTVTVTNNVPVVGDNVVIVYENF